MFTKPVWSCPKLPTTTVCVSDATVPVSDTTIRISDANFHVSDANFRIPMQPNATLCIPTQSNLDVFRTELNLVHRPCNR